MKNIFLIVSIGFGASLLTAMEKKLVINPELEQQITCILKEQSYWARENKAKKIGELFLKSPYKSYDPAVEEFAKSKTYNGTLIKRIVESKKKDPHYIPDAEDSIRAALDLNTSGAQKWLKSSIKKNDNFKEAAAKRLYRLALFDDDIDQVEFLINAGAPLNEKTVINIEKPGTPLMLAAQTGSLK